MTMKAKFGGICKACGCAFPVDARIDWMPGQGATHATPADCAIARALRAAAHAVVSTVQTAAAPLTLDMKPVADFLARAAGKLKFPKVVFLAPCGGELRLYVAGPRSKFPGSIQVLVNDNWIGRITPAGEAQGRTLTSDATLVAALRAIAADPAAAAKSYAALRGACSFCAKPLTDDGSIEVGYGPVCAKHYNLPWKAQGTKVLATATGPRPSLTKLVRDYTDMKLDVPEGGM